MLSAILIILSLPFTDTSKIRGMQFNSYTIITFYIFIANLLVLLVLGAKHVEFPYIELGQISAIIYFLCFVIFPLHSIIFNTYTYVNTMYNIKKSNISLFFVKKNTYRCFSTTSYLLMNNNNNNEDNNPDGNNDNNSNDEENEENETDRDKDDGYESYSDRSLLENDFSTLASYPPRNLPEGTLREWIKDTEDIKRHPETAGLEEDGSWQRREHWVERNKELREELERRKYLGRTEDSPGPSEGSCQSCKEDNSVSINSYYSPIKSIDGTRPVTDTDLTTRTSNVTGIDTNSVTNSRDVKEDDADDENDSDDGDITGDF